MIEILTLFASQTEPPISHPMWPYMVAIGALASAVGAMFTYIVKLNKDFRDRIFRIYEEHRAFDEARSVRIAAEHERKDQKLAELGNKSAVMLERVASVMEMRRNGGNDA